MTKKLVLVESVSMFRMRHVIEVEDMVEHAGDELIFNNKLIEMSQKHLDDIIVSLREIDQKEFLKIFDEDNDYLKDWSEDKKLEYINKIDFCTVPPMGLSSDDREWEYDGYGNRVYKGTMTLYPEERVQKND